MRKLDLSGDHKKHSNNIKIAWKAKLTEKMKLIQAVMDRDAMLSDGVIGIYTTWSDGRFENKAHPWVKSNLELQLYLRQEWLSLRTDSLMQSMRERVDFTLENIEQKVLDKDSIALYRWNSGLVFPTRTWDSIQLYGPEDVTRTVFQKLSEEIIRDGKLSSKFYDRLRTHKMMMSTWIEKYKWEIIESYDLQSWIFHYDPENSQFAVKNGPLRYVQYLLALALMRYIRDTKQHPDFMKELPTNIIDRLDYIKVNGLTSKSFQDIEELKDIYAFLLYLYHEVQYRNFSESATKFVLEDRDKLRDIRDMLELLSRAFRPQDFFLS